VSKQKVRGENEIWKEENFASGILE